MSRLPHHANVPAGIVVGDDANVKLSLVVLLDRFDHRRLPSESDIHDIAALARTQSDPSPRLHFDAADIQASSGRFVFEKTPLPFVHCFSPPAGRSPRSTP